MDIATISADDLKAKLDRGDDFRLVMVLHEWAFQAVHIPGSIRFETPERAFDELDENDEIVVSCSDVACVASQFAYRALVDRGYTRVRRYAGGLSEWQELGYPLKGNAV